MVGGQHRRGELHHPDHANNHRRILPRHLEAAAERLGLRAEHRGQRKSLRPTAATTLALSTATVSNVRLSEAAALGATAIRPAVPAAFAAATVLATAIRAATATARRVATTDAAATTAIRWPLRSKVQCE